MLHKRSSSFRNKSAQQNAFMPKGMYSATSTQARVRFGERYSQLIVFNHFYVGNDCDFVQKGSA